MTAELGTPGVSVHATIFGNLMLVGSFTSTGETMVCSKLSGRGGKETIFCLASSGCPLRGFGAGGLPGIERRQVIGKIVVINAIGETHLRSTRNQQAEGIADGEDRHRDQNVKDDRFRHPSPWKPRGNEHVRPELGRRR